MAHAASRRPRKRCRTRALGVSLALGFALGLAAAWAPAARAQIQLPSRLPTVPAVPDLTRRAQEIRPVDTLTSAVPLQELRSATVRSLLQQHRDTLEADPAGEPVVRGELLLASPTPALIDVALASGYRMLRTEVLEGLDERVVVLAPPRGTSLSSAAARLRGIDPGLTVDFNHVYTRSGSVDDPAPAAQPIPGRVVPENRIASSSRRVGLIDGGIDARHPALLSTPIRTWGCAGRAIPSLHGTAVASLLVGRDAEFLGSAPRDTRLFAADIYCDTPTGGASDRLLQAMAWMALERVPVVNVSLVGPSNRLLERVVAAMNGRGHLIVAAVGNDGPAAPPLYPASYPGVIGVTGVGPSNQVLPEAAQGPQVAFAAPGAELAVARAGESGYVVARGTSFAAPAVAGLLSESLAEPDVESARRATRQCQQRAIDLGAPGRDDVYGWGLLDWIGRASPQRLHARRDAAF